MKIVRRGNSESIFIWLVERRHAEGPRNPNQPPVQHHGETTLRETIAQEGCSPGRSKPTRPASRSHSPEPQRQNALRCVSP